MKLFVGWKLFVVSILLTVPFFTWSITRIVKSQHFEDNCSYHINEALSPTISTDGEAGIKYTSKEIDNAISYLETNNLTSGYTTIAGKSSREDLNLFYQDLQKRSNYIHSQNPDNMKKYSEYISMKNLISVNLSTPEGISIYPHNTLYFVWFLISIALVILAIIGIVTFIDERSTAHR